MSKQAVVIGGGIAGIFSSLVLAKQGYSVLLVEKNKDIGGLLRSRELFEKGLFFDYGTHFLRQTGNDEIDNILFNNLPVYTFPYLKTGAYHKSLNDNNGFISDENLEERGSYLNQLLNNQESQSKTNNLGSQLKQLFGQGYANNLLKPAIEKFYFTPVSDLAENSHILFGLSRIMAGDAELTRGLKKEKKFDNVLAFHSYKEGLSANLNMYPSFGGAGGWITHLQKELEGRGVEILTGVEIDSIEKGNGNIKSVLIENESYHVDLLVCTIPPFLLLKKLGVEFSTKPPKRLTSAIFHYLVDENYLTDLYYFQCFDSDLKSFRVTLYDNYNSGKSDKYRVSVEVLLENVPEDIKSLQTEIFQELIKMSVFPSTAQILGQDFDIYPNGFPVLTQEFIDNSNKLYNLATGFASNLKFFGKGKSSGWFMNEIIHEIYNELKP